MEQGSPSADAQSRGTGCGSAACLGGSKRPLKPWGQGLQGIRAGLIRLGWIRRQGSHPMAWGSRFSRLPGQACSAQGQRVWDARMGHIPEQTLSLILQKGVYSLNVPTKGKFGLVSYKCLWSDGAGSRVERLLLSLATGAWSAPQGTRSSGCWLASPAQP